MNNTAIYDSKVFARIIGQTPVQVTGMEEGSEEVEILTQEGNKLTVRYEHDCCASCSICQVDGDPNDLVGAPLMMCEEVTDGLPEGPINDGEYQDESFTWTFVKFATTKGYVTLRWYGNSNGYYSESPTAYYNGKREYELARGQ